MAFRIYTKTGDDGTTGLFGGRRVAKYDLRIEAYGTVDELNSSVGMAIAETDDEELRSELLRLSSLLFTVGADLATPLSPPPKYPIPRTQEGDIALLERGIDAWDGELPELKSFILPGGTRAAACLHMARTICRRAERLAVHLRAEEEITPSVVPFLNRLSDWLFTAARIANHRAGVADTPWLPPTHHHQDQAL
jgi:cob(I)alamin adenosyltransferase